VVEAVLGLLLKVADLASAQDWCKRSLVVDQRVVYALEILAVVDNAEIAGFEFVATAAPSNPQIDPVVVGEAEAAAAVAQVSDILLHQVENSGLQEAVGESLEEDNSLVVAVGDTVDLESRLSGELEVFRRIGAVAELRIDYVVRPRPLPWVKEVMNCCSVWSTAGAALRQIDLDSVNLCCL
jgi:hypothetical protein